MTAKNEITKNASFYFFKHLTFAETALISAFMQRSRYVFLCRHTTVAATISFLFVAFCRRRTLLKQACWCHICAYKYWGGVYFHALVLR